MMEFKKDVKSTVTFYKNRNKRDYLDFKRDFKQFGLDLM